MADGRNKRIAGYELLRIISMFMVLILHFNTQSGALMGAGSETTPSGIAAGLLESFCIVAVNVYVLISGYFLCRSTYTYRRLIRLWFEILFYAAVIPPVLTALSVPVEGCKGFWEKMQYMLPVSMQHYWFATAYFMLYLLVPVLNAAIAKLSRLQLKTVIVVLFFYECALKSISPVTFAVDRFGYDAFWFIFLYLLAAYMRIYDTPRIDHPAKAAVMYVGSSLLIFVLHTGLHSYNLNTGKLEYYAGVPFHYNSLLTLTGAVGLFCLFRFVHLKENLFSTVVRRIAPYTFGVYLIHEHIDVRDRWLPCLEGIFGKVSMTDPLIYVLQAVLLCLMLYVICTLADMIRSILFSFVGRMIKRTGIAGAADKLDDIMKKH